MKQTISGNTAFIKRTVLPMTKQAGIKKVSVKILPAQLPDDKEKMEVSFDVDKETNDNLLDLLKKKAGKKGTKKRQNLNLTVMKELLSKIIKKEIQKLKKESVNEGGMGILDKDQTDVLHGIVIKNKSKNSKAILSIAMKGSMFKGIDKKELLGYIEGAREFVKYMSMGRTGKELSVNEEIIDWQGKYDYEFKFKEGQLVKDINPDCPHIGSEGEVTKVTKDEVTYTVRNNGKTYKIGDELTKTKDQLIPLSINESGILYRAGVKKYGKEGMRKIQQAAGKRKSHAEIGKIKDKYEKKKKESVNEAVTNIKKIELILKKRQAMKIDGYLVDMQTANVIMKVWKALNSSNKKKFAPLPIKKMANVAWKLVS